MPLYEYQCTTCGQIEEAIQKFSDAPLHTCRHCSGKLNKLISQSSFHLKGTGWYVTDYSKKQSPAATGSAAEPASDTDKKKSESAADTKSAATDS